MLNSYKLFKAVFSRQIKICKYNVTYIIYPITYFVVSLLIFRVSMHYHDHLQNVSYGIFFSLNIMALSFSNPVLLEQDYNNGILEQFYITGCNLCVVILAKYLCHYLIYTATSIPTILLSFVFLDISFDGIYHVFVAIMLTNAMSLLGMLFASSLLMGTQSGILQSITILILIIPALIFAILSLTNIAYIALLFALFLVMLPTLTLCSKQLILVALEDKN